ncbi:MAG: hypothetical protein ACD_19C00429G0006 [uncultured bacterium]|nr:MAG: hypothetical protein ACD_19C00429G0006 [uncultured bacterium]
MNLNLTLDVIAIVISIVSLSLFIWIYFVFKDLIKISKDKEFSNNTKEIKNIWTEILNIKDVSRLNIQRVGLVKFNPFDETGGDHSFSLALLDGNKNGIIITSLHTRERTRLYLKEVFSGKVNIKLSKEEQKALKIADGKNN